MGYSPEITNGIVGLTADLPFEVVQKLAEICFDYPQLDRIAEAKRRFVGALAHERPRYQARQLFGLIAREGLAPQTVGYALIAAAKMEQTVREAQKVSLLWTGPDTPKIPVRRNEQALLDLIVSAKRELHIVSYVAYRADAVLDALEEAVGRGVEVHLYLETVDKDGRSRQEGVRHLGQVLVLACHLYEWPLSIRERVGRNKVGAMHAKLAIADGETLFVSSANLTGYAMHHNMEMGVLFEGGDEPTVVQAHLGRLVEKGVFRPLSPQKINVALKKR